MDFTQWGQALDGFAIDALSNHNGCYWIPEYEDAPTSWSPEVDAGGVFENADSSIQSVSGDH
jgi:hypothetical protein